MTAWPASHPRPGSPGQPPGKRRATTRSALVSRGSTSSPSAKQRIAAADEGTVVALTPVRRPQGRYEGSMRQRRGALLGELAAAGWADPARDPEAAASLVADGLADARDGRLVRVT